MTAKKEEAAAVFGGKIKNGIGAKPPRVDVVLTGTLGARRVKFTGEITLLGVAKPSKKKAVVPH